MRLFELTRGIFKGHDFSEWIQLVRDAATQMFPYLTRDPCTFDQYPYWYKHWENDYGPEEAVALWMDYVQTPMVDEALKLSPEDKEKGMSAIYTALDGIRSKRKDRRRQDKFHLWLREVGGILRDESGINIRHVLVGVPSGTVEAMFADKKAADEAALALIDMFNRGVET